MNTFTKLGVAAAAVIVLAIVGFSIFPRTVTPGGPGGPTGSPSPTPVIPVASGLLQPGAYRWPIGDPVVPFHLTFTVPNGWQFAGWAIERGSGTSVTVSPWTVRYTYGDPCRWMSSVVDPGPAVQGLVDALGRQVGRNATTPVPVTIDGHEGQRIELDVPADMDATQCDGREYRSWVAPGSGVSGTAVDEPSRSGFIPGLHSVVTILDIDGSRVIIEATYPARATAAVRSELDAIVDSMVIEP